MTSTGHRRRSPAALLAALLAIVVVMAPGTAYADPPGPTDWRSEVVSITPATDAVTAAIEGGDAFVRLVVAPGHDVVVEGYAGEPYLWFDADGVVHENRRSPATYYNADRQGVSELPAVADPDAEPDWQPVADGGSWAWHDHRAHWMGGDPPPGLAPGDSLPPTVVPLIVDGVATGVEVVTTLQDSPSPWPAIVAAVLAVAVVALTALAGRRLPLAVPLVVLAVGATVVGLVQWGSLPSDTGRLLIWWLPAAIAAICAAALLFVPRSQPFARAALTLVAAVQLVVWGWARKDALVRAVLPTSAPFWLDRAVTAAVLAGAVAAVAVAVYDLSSEIRARSRAR